MLIKGFDLLSNCLHLFFKQLCGDHFEQFACGYWDLKNEITSLLNPLFVALLSSLGVCTSVVGFES